MPIPHSTPNHHIIKRVFEQQLPKLMHTKKLCLPDSHLAYLPVTHSPPKCGKQSSFSLWSSLNLVAAASKRWKIQHFLCNAECPCVNVLCYMRLPLRISNPGYESLLSMILPWLWQVMSVYIWSASLTWDISDELWDMSHSSEAAGLERSTHKTYVNAGPGKARCIISLRLYYVYLYIRTRTSSLGSKSGWARGLPRHSSRCRWDHLADSVVPPADMSDKVKSQDGRRLLWTLTRYARY